MVATSMYQAALYLVLLLSASALDPKYRTQEFLTSREHGLDTSNIHHMQQCLLTSGIPALHGNQSAIDQMYIDIRDWYMNMAGERAVVGSLCKRVHCVYNLHTCLHPTFTSLDFLEVVVVRSVEVCAPYCEEQASIVITTPVSTAIATTTLAAIITTTQASTTTPASTTPTSTAATTTPTTVPDPVTTSACSGASRHA
ncbi:integumentary mucin C.1-like [Nilaparvata lugens]|uniref:integumentary mucin C.1-like n=1 Tax=Nilaparvata lugens TaxID=108931 RepID=UPI00193D077B|nr:integumentary mucin C.1-like [Nilaparvata lugens]XP_039292242.1 integumentary mucin C.1-like [Nilaparvata lugens]